MKTLCIIAVSSVFMFGSVQTTHAQNWKDLLGSKNKNKEVPAEELTEEEIEKLLGGRLEDDGITNEFHKQNLRKIVFHDSKMDTKDVNASTVRKKFSINEPIYFTVFLPYSVRNHLLYEIDDNGEKKMGYSYDYKWEKWKGTDEKPTYNAYGSTKIQFFLDGKEMDAGVFLNDIGFRSKKTAFSHWIIANPSEVDVKTEWIDLMQSLEPGEHKVEIKICGYKTPTGTTTMSTLEPIATGEFILVKKEGEKYAPKYGRNWGDYVAGKSDKDLEAKILAALQDRAKKLNYKEKFTAVKIKNNDWGMTRHAISGIITGREITAYCKSVWPNGTCKVQSFVFRQDHDGNDFQSTVYCKGVARGSYQKTIDCD